MKYCFSVFLDKPKRVDIYISTLFSDFSRSYVQKIIDRWQLKVNDKKIKKNVKIQPKDEIKISIELESLDIEPEDIPLDIIYEDKELLIVNKDAWINVHPVPWEGGKSWTLVNAVLYHCKNDLPSIGWVERPWIVHRLDKNTSWIIMIAKSDKMMNYLSEIIKDRKIDKYYYAIVHGVVKQNKFKIESYIWRDKNDRTRMTINNPVNPKLAISYWEIIKYIDNKYTLLKVKIETWRTHQIRVHLASIGHFILWDDVYWNKRLNKEIRQKYWLKRQALHAHKLILNLYGKKEEFIWDLKEDIKKLL